MPLVKLQLLRRLLQTYIRSFLVFFSLQSSAVKMHLQLFSPIFFLLTLDMTFNLMSWIHFPGRSSIAIGGRKTEGALCKRRENFLGPKANSGLPPQGNKKNFQWNQKRKEENKSISYHDKDNWIDSNSFHVETFGFSIVWQPWNIIGLVECGLDRCDSGKLFASSSQPSFGLLSCHSPSKYAMFGSNLLLE